MAKIQRKRFSFKSVFKVIGIAVAIYLILCVIEHSAALTNTDIAKPSYLIGWVSGKSVDFFWWCGKLIAHASYVVYVGTWELFVFIKNNLWVLMKNLCTLLKKALAQIAKLVRWIDYYLKINEFFWGAWNILKETTRFLLSPLYTFGGYFVSVVKWSAEAAANYSITFASWYVFWYLCGNHDPASAHSLDLCKVEERERRRRRRYNNRLAVLNKEAVKISAKKTSLLLTLNSPQALVPA